jgi:hypothetical protein
MECKICFDRVEKELFTKLECGHEYCSECIIELIETATRSYSMLALVCPEIRCRRKMSSNFIADKVKSAGHFDCHEKFTNMNNDLLVLKDPTKLMCINMSCNYVFSVRNKHQKQFFQCEKCKTQFCGVCKLEDHEMGLCPKDSTDNFRALIKERVMTYCPACHVPIEKSEGCNHMSCSICTFQFCWLCNKKFTRFHFSHYNFLFGCPGMQNSSPSEAFKLKLKYYSLLFAFIFLLLAFGVLLYYIWTVVKILLTAAASLSITALIFVLLFPKMTTINFALITVTIFVFFGWIVKGIGVMAGILAFFGIGRKVFPKLRNVIAQLFLKHRPI